MRWTVSTETSATDAAKNARSSRLERRDGLLAIGLFLVAAIVTVAAVPPALALGGHARAAAGDMPGETVAPDGTRMLTGDGRPEPDLIL